MMRRPWGIADSSDQDDSLDQDENEPDDDSEGIAQAAFDELNERGRNFGTRGSLYPFEITENTINLKDGGENSLYTFLALLSRYGKNNGPEGTDAEKIFEEVCAKAAEAYFGGGPRVKSFVFGFPRKAQPKGFAAALDSLCKSMGEGGSHHKERPNLRHQKDGKLDIVAWVEFEDTRQGKLITFGQCATGRNWGEKISELQPDPWCSQWMHDKPTVMPTRSFFVPHRIEEKSWSVNCRYGGILYDRCRIASLVSQVEEDLNNRWVAWSAHVLTQIRGT